MSEIEDRLKGYFTLVTRYRKAQTELSKNTIIGELKQLHNTTSSGAVRLKVSTFLSSVGAWGKAS